MKLSFGKFLQDELKKEGKPSLQDFASMIGTSYRTLYNVFNGTSELTISQVIKASEILRVDLVGEYVRATNAKLDYLEEPSDEIYGKKKPELITFSVNISGTFQNYSQNFSDMLNELKHNVEQFGFKLS